MISYRSVQMDKKKSIERILTEDSPEREYTPGLEKFFNCHDGQRKLLWSEIEFYTLISQQYHLNEILVVYAGSGEGLHMSIIFDLFPQLDFILIDPTHSLCKHPFMKNKEKVIQLNEYYTDLTYKKILSLNTKNKKIVFMSDIREDTDEKAIWENMIQQQLWCIQLDSIAYLLKFRLPYYFPGHDPSKYQYLLPLSKDKANYQFKKLNDKEVVYLKGDIYLQIYAPAKSTENRLLYIRKPNESFTFHSYDIKKYEDQCFYFNTYTRHENFEYKESQKCKYNLLGFDDGYESVCEYFILYQYIDIFYDKLKNEDFVKETRYRDILRDDTKSISDRTIQLLYQIDQLYNLLTYKNLIECSFRTSLKRGAVPNETKDEKEKIRINDYVEIVKSKYLEIIFSMKYQIESFQKNNILKRSEYDNQIQLSEDILSRINHYMHQILSRKYLKKDEKYFITEKIIGFNTNVLSSYLKSNKKSMILSKEELMMMKDTKDESFQKLMDVNHKYEKLIQDLEEIQSFKKKNVDSYFL